MNKKFAVETPLKWYANFKLRSCKRFDIIQTFLDLPKDLDTKLECLQYYDSDGSIKIQHRLYSKATIGKHYNEFYIGQENYINKLKYRDKSTFEIRKSRYIINHVNKKFTLDILKDELEGLAFIECDVFPLEKIWFPPFFSVKEDVTNDTKFADRSLCSMVI